MTTCKFDFGYLDEVFGGQDITPNHDLNIPKKEEESLQFDLVEILGEKHGVVRVQYDNSTKKLNEVQWTVFPQSSDGDSKPFSGVEINEKNDSEERSMQFMFPIKSNGDYFVHVRPFYLEKTSKKVRFQTEKVNPTVSPWNDSSRRIKENQSERIFNSRILNGPHKKNEPKPLIVSSGSPQLGKELFKIFYSEKLAKSPTEKKTTETKNTKDTKNTKNTLEGLFNQLLSPDDLKVVNNVFESIGLDGFAKIGEQVLESIQKQPGFDDLIKTVEKAMSLPADGKTIPEAGACNVGSKVPPSHPKYPYEKACSNPRPDFTRPPPTIPKYDEFKTPASRYTADHHFDYVPREKTHFAFHPTPTSVWDKVVNRTPPPTPNTSEKGLGSIFNSQWSYDTDGSLESTLEARGLWNKMRPSFKEWNDTFPTTTMTQKKGNATTNMRAANPKPDTISPWVVAAEVAAESLRELKETKEDETSEFSSTEYSSDSSDSASSSDSETDDEESSSSESETETENKENLSPRIANIRRQIENKLFPPTLNHF